MISLTQFPPLSLVDWPRCYLQGTFLRPHDHHGRTRTRTHLPVQLYFHPHPLDRTRPKVRHGWRFKESRLYQYTADSPVHFQEVVITGNLPKTCPHFGSTISSQCPLGIHRDTNRLGQSRRTPYSLTGANFFGFPKTHSFATTKVALFYPAQMVSSPSKSGLVCTIIDQGERGFFGKKFPRRRPA